MQRKWRKWYIEKVELKTFEKFGLDLRGADILEAGCRNGYFEFGRENMENYIHTIADFFTAGAYAALGL